MWFCFCSHHCSFFTLAEVEEEELALSETDEESEVCGWLTCKSRHVLTAYGDPSVFIGRTFTVPEKYRGKAFFADMCPHGKVHSVVRRRVWDADSLEEADVYFKIYNHHSRKASPTYPNGM